MAELPTNTQLRELAGRGATIRRYGRSKVVVHGVPYYRSRPYFSDLTVWTAMQRGEAKGAWTIVPSGYPWPEPPPYDARGFYSVHKDGWRWTVTYRLFDEGIPWQFKQAGTIVAVAASEAAALAEIGRRLDHAYEVVSGRTVLGQPYVVQEMPGRLTALVRLRDPRQLVLPRMPPWVYAGVLTKPVSPEVAERTMHQLMLGGDVPERLRPAGSMACRRAG
jgi:hypothetical protein